MIVIQPPNDIISEQAFWITIHLYCLTHKTTIENLTQAEAQTALQAVTATINATESNPDVVHNTIHLPLVLMNTLKETYSLTAIEHAHPYAYYPTFETHIPQAQNDAAWPFTQPEFPDLHFPVSPLLNNPYTSLQQLTDTKNLLLRYELSLFPVRKIIITPFGKKSKEYRTIHEDISQHPHLPWAHLQ